MQSRDNFSKLIIPESTIIQKVCRVLYGLDDFDGIAPVKVLKHCSTKWLSLERALKRLLLLWPALYAYFDSEVDNSTDKARLKRVSLSLDKVETKLYICNETT